MTQDKKPPDVCPLCKKKVDDSGWWWGGGEERHMAHKECVLKECDEICTDKFCKTMSVNEESGGLCPECGDPSKKLTERMKKVL